MNYKTLIKDVEENGLPVANITAMEAEILASPEKYPTLYAIINRREERKRAIRESH